MTREACMEIAKSAYISLWGLDWVKENAKYIGTNEGMTDKDGFFRYEIERWIPPTPRYYKNGERALTISSSTEGVQHRTSFRINTRNGNYEIVEHF